MSPCVSPTVFRLWIKAIHSWNKGFFLGYSIETLPSLLVFLIKLLAVRINSLRGKPPTAATLPSLASVLFPVKSVPLAVFFGTFSASYGILRVVLSRLIFKITGGDPHSLVQAPSPMSSSNSLVSLEQQQQQQSPPKGRERIHPLATFLAGTVAGAAILLDAERHGKERRVTLALYLLVRAGEVAAESGVKRGLLPSFYHADTLLFTLSCAEIMYSWFFTPETLPPAYDRWITRLADMDPRIMKYLRQRRAGTVNLGEHSDTLLSYALDNHLDPALADPRNGFLDCVVNHPDCGSHCSMNSYKRLRNGFLSSLLIYLPVHFLPLIFWRFGALKNKPAEMILKTALASARSAAFLGTYISLIWSSVCLVRNLVKDDTIYGPMLGSFMCGLSLLIEKKSRRLELALYCFPRAMGSLALKAERNHLLPVIPGFETFLFAVSSGAFLYFFEHEPDVMKPTFVSFLRWLLKN